MPRVASVALVVLFAVTSVQSAGAVPQQDRAEEIAVLALEEILGAPPEEVIVVRGDYATSYEVRLSAGEMARYRQSKAKDQVLLTAGRALSTPSSTSSLITGATIACVFDYYYWWAYVNYSPSTFNAQITHQLKGPGKKFTSRFTQPFSGGTVAVVVPNSTHEVGDDRPGVYQHQIKANGLGGTGKVKLRYVATGTGC